MKKVYLSLAFILTSLTTQGFSSYHSYRSKVQRVTHRLANQVENFHTFIERLRPHSHLAKDIHEFSELVEHLHHTVDDAIEDGTSLNHTRRDFKEVRKNFNHLRITFHPSYLAYYNHHVRDDFYHIEKTYKKLRLVLRKGHRHHRHGYHRNHGHRH